eukprot:ctg_1206.g422
MQGPSGPAMPSMPFLQRPKNLDGSLPGRSGGHAGGAGRDCARVWHAGLLPRQHQSAVVARAARPVCEERRATADSALHLHVGDRGGHPGAGGVGAGQPRAGLVRLRPDEAGR